MPSDNFAKNDPPVERKQDLGFWLSEILKPCAETTYADAMESLREVMNRSNTVQAFAAASSHAFLARGGSNEDDIYG